MKTAPAPANLNATFDVPPPPKKTKKAVVYESYNIDHVHTDAETDDESSPMQVVPAWAKGAFQDNTSSSNHSNFFHGSVQNYSVLS
jgi:hypothetical protein